VIHLINYPFLKQDMTIGVTAPSSGVPIELHDLLKTACIRMENKGFRVICGETVWTQDKAKSAPAIKRAEELQHMMANDDIYYSSMGWGASY